MAKADSTMIPLGTIAPDYKLIEPASGQWRTLADCKGETGTLVMFICNHCPYVKQYNEELARLSRDYLPRGIGMIAINANDIEAYPDDAPDKMVLASQKHAYGFPYLYDETQAIAKAYQAECTPDFFLFDHSLACVYRGRLDDAAPGNSQPVTGSDLRTAIESLLMDRAISPEQKPSVGCSIKWKKNTT